MQGLFDSAGLEPLPLQDADILFADEFALPYDRQRLFDELHSGTSWRAEAVTVWGKAFMQPRLVAWFGDEGASYTYSGVTLVPSAWTPVLRRLRDVMQLAADATFNSVLLNLYRNEKDSMGFHSDDERELGPRPIIASLSLGETRTLVFKHKTRKDLQPVRLPLSSGSLLVMRGETQRNWKHGIEKESGRCGPRINLTFRQILRL